MGTATRTATPRHYLMCPPTYYGVEYVINPWMDPSRPVDRDAAMAQWSALRQVYLDLGHTVELIDPAPGLPDMIYAANGATVVDGVVYSANFRYPQRQPEGPLYQKWFADRGYVTHTAEFVNEGEGDLLVAGDVILAGTGFRTEPAAHAELADLFGRTVVSLELVDPRFYHLDTALAPLAVDADGHAEIAYLPGAFSPASLSTLRELYPDAIEVAEADAMLFGLNAVSDGLHVVLGVGAHGFTAQLRERGFEPIEVESSVAMRGGGSAKCCTLEIRHPADDAAAVTS